jgi:hypothetical protein
MRTALFIIISTLFCAFFYLPTARAEEILFSQLVKVEVFRNVPGTNLNDLLLHPGFPNDPDSVEFVRRIEYPVGSSGGVPPPADVLDDYGVRISGLLIPKEGGNYVFYLSGRGESELHLSPTPSPDARIRLAFEPSGNGVRAFETPLNRPGCDTGDCENISEPVSLDANGRYYFEVNMKAGTGGDNVAVAWTREEEALPKFTYRDPAGNVLETQLPIGPENLGVMADNQVHILKQPDNTIIAEGDSATFRVKVNQTPATLQWLRNGEPIAGATNTAFTAGPLTLAENGDKYTIRISNSLGTITSAEASVTVLKTLSIQEQPTDLSVQENGEASFSVTSTGTPNLNYQWQSALPGSVSFTNIPGRTNRTLAFKALPADNQSQFRVIVTSQLQLATSSVAKLTVSADVEPPTIRAAGSFFGGGMIVYFSEPVGPGAEDAASYVITGGTTVTRAVQVGPSAVFLETTPALLPGREYLLILNGVRDLAASGGNLVNPNLATFKTAPSAPNLNEGLVKYERWHGLNPGRLDELKRRILSGAAPDFQEARTSFEGPGNAADNYGARLSGWFVPPKDGPYIFAVSADDSGELFLSTDSDPGHKRLIAMAPEATGARVWNGTFETRSDSFPGMEWPDRATLSLKSGQAYYIELLWHDISGSDSGAATVWFAGDPLPASGTPSVLGNHLIRSPVSCPSCLIPRIEITRAAGGSVSITFESTLEAAEKIEGPFAPIIDAVSPYEVRVTDLKTRYFRVLR